ncbi:MAG: hypothetical protein SXQ77_09795 [Halobacteria archaeon]|nr:hypothetical protein [Halobacteria archaeon]
MLAALAVASTVAVGTGAISVTNADRTVKVNQVGDGVAYLGLEDTEYSTYRNGDLFINFKGNNGVGGLGLNDNAVTTVKGAKITNQGTTKVKVTVSSGSGVSASVGENWLNPGESTSLDVTVNTHSLDDGDTRTITINANEA